MAHSPINIYGIKTCDTVRKARRWLETHQVEHHFLDLREEGILTSTRVEHWLAKVKATDLVNKRSTTWKQLEEDQRDQVSAWLTSPSDQAALIAFLQANPTLIKRPIFEQSDDVWVGFKADQLTARL